MSLCGVGMYECSWPLYAVLATSSLMLQKPQRYEVQTFASLLEVRVLDDQAKSVTGLVRADFRLLEAGVERPVVLLAVFEREFHLLPPLARERGHLIEALTNFSPGGRPGFWSRLGNLFVSTSNTESAIDEGLLEMKEARSSSKSLLVFSAGFGNLGRATLDHVELAGARFFSVALPNRAGDVFSLGGDQAARRRIELRNHRGFQVLVGRRPSGAHPFFRVREHFPRPSEFGRRTGN